MIIDGLKTQPQYNNTEGTIRGWSNTNKRWKILMDHDGLLLELKIKNLTPVAGESGLTGTGTGGAQATATGTATAGDTTVNDAEGSAAPGASGEKLVEGEQQAGFYGDDDLYEVYSDGDATDATEVISSEDDDDSDSDVERIVVDDDEDEVAEELGLNDSSDEDDDDEESLTLEDVVVQIKSRNQRLMEGSHEMAGEGGFAVGVAVKITGLKSRADLNDAKATIHSFNEENQRWKVKTADGKMLELKEKNLKIDTDPGGAAPAPAAPAPAPLKSPSTVEPNFSKQSQPATPAAGGKAAPEANAAAANDNGVASPMA